MAWPSTLVRTKNWGNETLTDTDLEGQLDLIIDWSNDMSNATTGHKHDGTTSEGPLLSVLASTVTSAVTFSGVINLSGTAGTFTNDPVFSSGNGLMPSGGIIAWSGAISAIPTGWVICDGTNSTPDLSGHFIIHADADSGGTHNPDDTPTMTSAHSHTMDAHTHTLIHKNGSDPRLQTTSDGSNETNSDYTTSATSTMQSAGSQTGYALAYIMKT